MAEDLIKLLGKPEGTPISTQSTKPDLVSLLGEPELKKKEESVVGVGESGDSRFLSSTPDRELLQEPQAVAPTSKEISPEKPKGNETVKALKSSSARAFGGIIGLPAFITDQLGSFVVKPIAKGLGYSDEEAEGAAMALRAAPIMGTTTSGIQSAEAQQQLNKYASSIEATMKQYEDGIIGSITNGNYSDAGAQLWKGAVQTLPYLAMTIATSGGGTPAVLSTIGTTAAAQRYGELQDPTSEEGKKLSETGKFVNSWGYGAFEAAGELVTMGLANAAKRTLSSLGKEALEEVSQGIAKQAMKGFAEEGASEGATELSQQVLDIIQGVRDNVDFSAVTDAILVGGVTGAGISGTPTAISKAAKAIAGRKVASDADIKTVNENNAKVVDLLAEKEKATSPEAAQVIDNQLQEVVNANNEIITKNETIVEQMTPEQILKVNELDKTIAEYDSRIDDETETTDPKVLKSIRDELQKQKEEVVSIAAKQVSETKPKEEVIKPTEAIYEPVEARSAEEAPIVSPEQKEGLKQTKQESVRSILELPTDLLGDKKEPWMQEEGYDNYHQRLLDKNYSDRKKLIDEQDKYEEGSEEWNKIEEKISNNYSEEEAISKEMESERKKIIPSSQQEELIYENLNKKGNVVSRGETGANTVIDFTPNRDGIIYTSDFNNNELAKDYAFQEYGGKIIPVGRTKGNVASAEISKDAKILDTTTETGLNEFEKITGIKISGDKTAYDYLDGKKEVVDKIRSFRYDAVRTEERDARHGMVRVGTSLAIINDKIINKINVDYSKTKVENKNGTIKKALDEGLYEKAIAEGRMTKNDAIKIIESAGLEIPKTIKQQKQPSVGEQITEVKQVKQQENGKETSDETQGGQKGRQEVLIEAQQKTIREVKREENKQRLASIFDDIATLTGARKEITGEERRIIRKRILDNAVEYIKTEFDIVGDALREKVKSFLKENNFSDEDIVDEEIDNSIKEKGYAEGTRTTTEEAGQQAQGVVEGEKGQIRLGDNAKTWASKEKIKTNNVLQEYLDKWAKDVIGDKGLIKKEIKEDFDLFLTKLRNLNIIETDCG